MNLSNRNDGVVQSIASQGAEKFIIYNNKGELKDISDSARKMLALVNNEKPIEQVFSEKITYTDKNPNLKKKLEEMHTKVSYQKQSLSYFCLAESDGGKKMYIFCHEPVYDNEERLVGTQVFIYSPVEFWSKFDVTRSYPLDNREILILILLVSGAKLAVIARVFQLNIMVIQHLKSMLLGKLGTKNLKVRMTKNIREEDIEKGVLLPMTEFKTSLFSV